MNRKNSLKSDLNIEGLLFKTCFENGASRPYVLPEDTTCIPTTNIPPKEIMVTVSFGFS